MLVARKYWAKAGVANKVVERLGPAKDTLRWMLREQGPNSFDVAFIGKHGCFSIWWRAAATEELLLMLAWKGHCGIHVFVQGVTSHEGSKWKVERGELWLMGASPGAVPIHIYIY